MLFESIPESQVATAQVNSMLGLCSNFNSPDVREYGWNLYTRIANNLPALQLPIRNMLIGSKISGTLSSSSSSSTIYNKKSKIKNKSNSNSNYSNRNITTSDNESLTGMANIMPGIEIPPNIQLLLIFGLSF